LDSGSSNAIFLPPLFCGELGAGNTGFWAAAGLGLAAAAGLAAGLAAATALGLATALAAAAGLAAGLATASALGLAAGAVVGFAGAGVAAAGALVAAGWPPELQAVAATKAAMLTAENKRRIYPPDCEKRVRKSRFLFVFREPTEIVPFVLLNNGSNKNNSGIGGRGG
jgi:hypothetical protein